MEWLPLRQTFLDELLRHDGKADYLQSEGCSACDVRETQLFRCLDCWDGCHLTCRGCLSTAHSNLPFHHVEVCMLHLVVLFPG